jgi:Tol biopolymer transport system component/tRNA A-37 threonylcarbamoyl transferase component Bud32
MMPDRWQRLKQIFQSALERHPAERDAFLSQACAGDEALRSEVESLISSHDQAGDSIEAMAVEAATEMLANDRAIVGKQIGRFQILSQIGRGGMGEVFLAQDMSLSRKVAIKLLRSDFTENEERLRRFRQEAQAASALNHPNILTIHEIGQENSLHFMATEYVEGETLRQHISRARMTLGQALDTTIQVASALAAAHQAGIIHRDIKPENIMLRTDGYVKVLDFGLAKLIEAKAIDTEAPTLQKVETEPGLVMGTVNYMSPEQARGLPVDTRTDIWSLGVMIYEMVAGRQPFESETASDVMSLILQKEPPPLARSLPEVPSELERMVRKTLRKDREERYQTIKDLLIDLRNLRKELELGAEMERSLPPATTRVLGSGPSTSAMAHSTSSAEYIVTEIKQHKRAAALILGIIIIAGVTLYALSRRNSSTTEAPTIKGTFTQLSDQSGPEYFPSLSPDGKSFVYAGLASGNWDIYLQRVGGKNPVNLTKDSPFDDTQPAFSPDGERIAFRSEREGGGLFVMGATGESIKRLTDFGSNPAWSPDGKEIACADEGPVNPAIRNNPNSRVWAVNVATGERRQLTKEDSIQPNWSPHGNRIAYGGRRNAAQRDIWTIPAGGGEPTEVTNDPAIEGSPVWSPDGKYLYFASDRAGSMNVWRVPIEEQTGKVLGPAEAVTTPSPYSAHLSFSLDGRRLAYSQIVRGANLQQVGFDPDTETVTGQPVWITQGSRWTNTPHLSPDGEWLAFDAQGGKQDDLFVIRRDGTGLRQLTDDPYKDRQPRWSPDGKRIAFFSDRSSKWEIWMINSDGSGLKQLTYAPGIATNPAWSPDGTRLSYRNAGGASPSIFEVEKPWTEQSPQVLPSMSDSTNWGVWSWSPDGRKLAGNKLPVGTPISSLVYSVETQHYEKLTDFGGNPVWLSDSRRLLFQHQGKLYLIDSQSKKVREVLSVGPNSFGNGVTLSRDDRQIYFSLVTTEADIWLMNFE